MPNRKRPISLSPEADEDLIEIWGYLAREASERVADRQLREIDAACLRSTFGPIPAESETTCCPVCDQHQSIRMLCFIAFEMTPLKLSVFCMAVGISLEFLRKTPLTKVIIEETCHASAG